MRAEARRLVRPPKSRGFGESQSPHPVAVVARLQSARGCLWGKRRYPSEDGPLVCCRFRRQAAEQYRTWSQQAAHFFRQVKRRPQAAQVLLGRWGFAWAIVSGLLSDCDGLRHRADAQQLALAEWPI